MKAPVRLGAVLAATVLLSGCVFPRIDGSTGDTGPTAPPSSPDAAPSVESLPFNASGLLGGDASPEFPDGDPGEVSVVAIGPLETSALGGTLLFAFRNNTAASIAHVDWIATARNAGAMVATGSSQGAIPAQVAPGEVGLAYIYFDNADAITDGAEYEFQVETSPADTSFYNTAPLKVTEVNVAGDSIVGAATNETGSEADGPFSVQVYCFDGDTILSQRLTFAEQSGPIDDGGTVTFSVDLFGEPCPSFAVGVDGYFS
jgi:hypothetical protein